MNMKLSVSEYGSESMINILKKDEASCSDSSHNKVI